MCLIQVWSLVILHNQNKFQLYFKLKHHTYISRVSKPLWNSRVYWIHWIANAMVGIGSDRNSIRFAPLGHNRTVGSCTENRNVGEYTEKMRMHRMFTWKTQIWGKNHGNPRTAKYHYERNTQMGHRDNNLLIPSFANMRLQQRQRPLSLSLSLSFSLSLALTVHSYTQKKPKLI